MARQHLSASPAEFSAGFAMPEVSALIDNLSMGYWFWVSATDHIVRTYHGDDNATGMGVSVNSVAGEINCLHGGINEFGGGSGYALNTWQSIIYTRSGGTAQIYLNGSALGASWTDAPNAVTGSGVFGPNIFYAVSAGTTAKQAECFFYSRVLSASEITEIGANRKSPLFFSNALTRYIPLFGQDNPEPTGSGGTFGGSNAVATRGGGVEIGKSDHPSILYPALVARSNRLRPRVFAPGLAR